MWLRVLLAAVFSCCLALKNCDKLYYRCLLTHKHSSWLSVCMKWKSLCELPEWMDTSACKVNWVSCLVQCDDKHFGSCWSIKYWWWCSRAFQDDLSERNLEMFQGNVWELTRCWGNVREFCSVWRGGHPDLHVICSHLHWWDRQRRWF